MFGKHTDEHTRTFRKTKENFRFAVDQEYGLLVNLFAGLLVAQIGRCGLMEAKKSEQFEGGRR